MTYWIGEPRFDAYLDMFGTDTIMFESNVSVDAPNGGDRTLRNAFKRLSLPLSADERADLCSRTAACTHKINL